ncbi:MAG: hypothetical protein ACTHQ3_14525 [Motilibacteraceae bacterium]
MPVRDPSAQVRATVLTLYAQGASLRRISTVTGVPRPAVRALLVHDGASIPARGAGRSRPHRRIDPSPDLERRLYQLYVVQRLPRARVAQELGVSESRVRTWLRRLGIAVRTRGRCLREDRARLPADRLEELYVRREHAAESVARQLGGSRAHVLTAAHHEGIPVRRGGNTTNASALVLLESLYADDCVRRLLGAHGIPVVRRPGTLLERFPTPVDLPQAALVDLYETGGLSVVHIEVLTGIPAATVLHRLHAADVRLRQPGGLSPFSRRARGLPAAPATVATMEPVAAMVKPDERAAG